MSRNSFCDFLADPGSRSFSRLGRLLCNSQYQRAYSQRLLLLKEVACSGLVYKFSHPIHAGGVSERFRLLVVFVSSSALSSVSAAPHGELSPQRRYRRRDCSAVRRRHHPRSWLWVGRLRERFISTRPFRYPKQFPRSQSSLSQITAFLESGLFFEFSPCLSRACLGKKVIFNI